MKSDPVKLIPAQRAPVDEWLTTEELAAWLKIPVATVYNWRSRKSGPPAYRVGKHLRFRRDEVREWVVNPPAKTAPSPEDWRTAFPTQRRRRTS